MTPQDFIAKWRNGGDERRDFQSFFDDLCRLLGHPTPREADPEHTWFTYEYGASKTTGGEGWADVWKRGFFGFEAKGTGKDLGKAYAQLKMYADALENPPLLIVSDLQRFEIHTNFTNAVKQVHRFTVEDLASHETRRLLSAAFNDPQQLRPGTTRADITKEAAGKFAALADALRQRGHEPHTVAHFLNRLLFCMFAEDIGLLPDHIFSKLVRSVQDKPDQFEARAAALFAAMKGGGDFALTEIEYFNGGLFEDASTLRLEAPELATLDQAARLDWSEIDPSIFGTLFERGLDPNKRSQLGAHYTDPDTIMKIVGPVVVDPLLAEWEAEKAAIAATLDKAKTKGVPKAAQQRFNAFLERLRAFRVLDPACGSGNFLFLALRALKGLESRVLWEGEALGLGRQVPSVGPANVLGIELNEYAADLARLTVWIGEIQWMIQNGYGVRRNPILQALGGIENRDALRNRDGTEAIWPTADVIVGNPPFVGNRKMVGELGRVYADAVRDLYEGRVSRSADFVCFWFAKADDAIRSGATRRAGLVATNSIRGGANREVLDRVLEQSRIFEAWSDEAWVNEGAAVRVSLICFGDSAQGAELDGAAVGTITSSLVELVHHDIAKAAALAENVGHGFQGITPRAEIQKKRRIALGLPEASFNLAGDQARDMLRLPANVRGERMAEVVRPYWIADDITTRPLGRFIVFLGERDELNAAMFEAPFNAIANVRLHREQMEDAKDYPWWRLWRPRSAMFAALAGLSRFISIPRVSKHHICLWTPAGVVPGDAIVVIARDDDTTLGVLQSHIHEVWALRQGSALEDRPRYTHTTSFETFPFPEGLTPNIAAQDYADNPHTQAIATAARALVEARDRWLNPPEWVNWERTPEEEAAGFPARPVAKPGHEAALKRRTLTNLYNERPAWLAMLHRTLDEAVATAYGWEWPLTDDEILRRLFELNQQRSAAQS
ncbi:MAG: class I SAM-dependent DNA methyltransferase [Xanthomonadales bacterium]|nr:class I SAM-dependent DNA methyltransferase [Xanthomonadales bacterium]